MTAPPSSDRFVLDAPGNLLLCGEYAVTEAGGRGLCLAPEIRASLVCRPCGGPLAIRAVWGDGGFAWRDGDPAPPLVQAAIDEIAPLARDGGLDAQALWSGHEFELDSAAFYQADGRKTGLGSSAAAALLLCAGLLALLVRGAAGRPGRALWSRLPSAAVAAHRRYQGGRGSGYDVLCSLQGGLAFFRGGPEPAVSAAPPALARSLGQFRLLAGPAPVRSGSSVARWQAWRDANPAAAAAYLERCAARVESLRRGGRPLAAVLAEAAADGVELGRAIGVDAQLPAAAADACRAAGRDLLAKSLGAGNETIIAAGPPGQLRRLAKAGPPLRPARAGLRAAPLIAESYGSGKLLLWGEHAALYGHPAVGLPLPQGCALRLAAGRPGQRPVHRLDGRPLAPGETAQIGALLQAAREAGLPGLPAGSELHIRSTVSRHGGQGSSAALSASLARLLAGLDGQGPADPDRLWRWANRLDSHFHGRASGIDSGLALSDRPLVFEPVAGDADLAVAGRPLRPPSSGRVWLVHGALPRRGGTKALTGRVRAAMQSGDAATAAAVQALGGIARQAVAALEGALDPVLLGDLADRAHALLAGLGLSTPALDAALAAGRKAGALGGKLSGAGGGGAFFLVCGSDEAARRVAAALPADCGPTGMLSLPMQEAAQAGAPPMGDAQGGHQGGHGQ